MSYLVARIDHALTRGINWLTTSLVERARGFDSSEAGDFLAAPGPNIHGYRLDYLVYDEPYPESPLVERETEEARSLVDQLAAQAPFFASSTDDERRRLLAHFGHDPDSAAATFDWKVGDKYCGQCGANITAISFHACPNRTLTAAEVERFRSRVGEIHDAAKTVAKTPTAGQRGESPVGDDSPTSPAGSPAWVDWAAPAICDVLAEHVPAIDDDQVVYGSNTFIHRSFADWQDWRDHVSDLIAARLDAASQARFCIDDGAPQAVTLNAVEYERFLDGWLNPGREHAAQFETGLDMGVSVASEFFPQHRNTQK